MIVPAGPEWVEEHLRRLTAAGIQPHFQLTSMPDLETVERLVRRGLYKGPLNLTWIGIGGGFDGPNPNNFMEFIRRAPDGSTITANGDAQRPALNVMAMAMGMHVRCGNEDTLLGATGEKMTSVQQVEQLARVARELAATLPRAAKRAPSTGSARISTEETLARNGMPPNRERGQRALPVRYAA